MECAYKFCVYQEEDKCILDEISVDESGMCDSMIQVEVNAHYLSGEKVKALEEFENQYEEWEKKDREHVEEAAQQKNKAAKRGK